MDKAAFIEKLKREKINNIIDIYEIKSKDRYDENSEKDVMYILFNKFVKEDQIKLWGIIDKVTEKIDIFPRFVKSKEH